jgi:poly-gamma-glutamate synthesis protein (capsule biosynthesis protein)
MRLWALALLVTTSGFAGPAKEAPLVTISAVGDLVPDFGALRDIQDSVRAKHGKLPALDYPFAKIRGQLQGVVFGNLETPITNRPVQHFADKNEIFYFRSPARNARSLARAGFDVLSLANNHIKDTGIAGLMDTKRLVEAQGMHAVGVGKNLEAARQPVLVKDGQATLAFLAYVLVIPKSVWATALTPGAATGDLASISADIKKAKPLADAVIVSLHWGVEVAHDIPVTPPSPAQEALARGLIDAGATLVLGHHNHAAGLIEEYKNGLIAYSLGNFVFAGSTKGGHQQSLILQATLKGDQLESYRVLPVGIGRAKVQYQPKLLGKKEAEAMKKRLLKNPSDKLKP